MRDDATKAAGSDTTPRIPLNAARVLGGLADAASQIAAGNKVPGLKPQAAATLRLDPARVLGGLADAATQAAAGTKPLGTKPTAPGRG